jgi:dihydroorotase-like cyclic amidohydrolase
MFKPVFLIIKGLFLSLILLYSVAAIPSHAQEFDVVILNGRVMDPETNYDAVANVGVKDGKIAVITKDKITGRETIDATGHVVAPGFIEEHNHWCRPLGYKLLLRDGVTTSMDVEAGVFGPRVDEWYKMHEGHSQVNYGTASSHEFARSMVTQGVKALDTPDGIVKSRAAGTAWSNAVLDIKDGNKMLEAIDEGLRQGALGVASTVGYLPGATAREMFEVQHAGARYGRFTSVHLRYTPGNPTTEANGAQEILSNAVALNAPAVICHFNNPGWQLVQELIVRTREQGHNVWGEIYPYAAGMTTINAQFARPEVWIDKLGHKYEETMQDPLTLEFYTVEKYRKVLKEAPATQIILYKMPPDDIPEWVDLKGIVFAGDGMPIPQGWDEAPTWDTPYEKIPNTHPRLAGTRGTAFRIGREKKIPLMHLIAASSYNPAKYLGDTGLEAMQMRGRMQVGKIADITIFNPATITDNSTYAKGTLPSSGIPYVLVNGVIVVKDSKVLKDVNPGQPIRFPVQGKGRFEPLSLESWEKEFLTVPEGFGAGGLDCCLGASGDHKH